MTHISKILGLLALSISLSQAEEPAGYRWDTIAMGGGGFVSAVIAHPNHPGLLYARTDVGGVYRWNEKEKTWIPLTDWVDGETLGFWGAESLAVDPNNPGRLFVLGGTSYWNKGKTWIGRSDDFGKSWKLVDVTSQFRANGNGMGRQNGEKLAVDPNSPSILFCGSRDSGLFRSSDAGETWTNVSGFPVTKTPNGVGISFVLFDGLSGQPGSPTPVLYVGVSRAKGGNIFLSRDAGETWEALPEGIEEGTMPQRAVLDNERRLVGTFANGAGPHGNERVKEPMNRGGVWRYEPISQNWTNLTPNEFSRPYSGIAFEPQSGKLVVSTINNYQKAVWGHGDRIYASRDDGLTWRDLVGGDNVSMNHGGLPWIEGMAMHWVGSLAFDPSRTGRLFLTSGNGIFRSDDIQSEEIEWIFSAKGLEETVPIDVVSHPNGTVLSAILDYDGFVHSDLAASPEGRTFKPGMGHCTALAVAELKPERVARVGGGGLQFSQDAGRTWTKSPSAPPATDGRDAPRSGRIAYSADGEVILWSPENWKGVYRSVDLGKSWAKTRGVDQPAFPVADPIDSGVFYIFHPDTGTLLLSTDAGKSFQTASRVSGGGNPRIRTVPGRQGHLWVPRDSLGLARSRNGGSSLEKIPNVTECLAVGIGKAADGADYDTVFIYGRVGDDQAGIYRSVDEGITWTRISDPEKMFGDLANGQFVVGDRHVFGRVYRSTAGRGVAYGEPISSPTQQKQ